MKVLPGVQIPPSPPFSLELKNKISPNPKGGDILLYKKKMAVVFHIANNVKGSALFFAVSLDGTATKESVSQSKSKHKKSPASCRSWAFLF